MNLQTFAKDGIDYQIYSVQVDKEFVHDIQRHLNRLGFGAGLVDGVWRKQTQEAFDRFKATNKFSDLNFTPSMARALLQPVPAQQKPITVAVGATASPTNQTNGASLPRPVVAPPPPPRRVAPPPPPRPIATIPSPQKYSVKINAAGLNLIKQFEGLRLEAYVCPAGIPTIGYGSTVGVKMGQKITPEQAEALLLKDLERFEAVVSQAVTTPLTSNQFSALVSFVFNTGSRAFKGSTLLKRLNQGDYQGTADQFLRWNRAGNQVLPGLARRRRAERVLFLQP